VEGGGIYRKTYLHSAPAVHIETDGVYAQSRISAGAIIQNNNNNNSRGHALGVSTAATAATVTATATIVNTGTHMTGPKAGAGLVAVAKVKVVFDLFDTHGDGALVGSAAAPAITLPPATSSSVPSTATTVPVTIDFKSTHVQVQLWSIARPYLYTLRTSVTGGDAINTTIGIYSTKWTGEVMYKYIYI
jgi:beta-galactosidase/beta-glucuronidase